MLKEKRKKDEVIEAPAASDKLSRKEFEKELEKLQVELTRLQAWVKDKGARIIKVPIPIYSRSTLMVQKHQHCAACTEF